MVLIAGAVCVGVAEREVLDLTELGLVVELFVDEREAEDFDVEVEGFIELELAFVDETDVEVFVEELDFDELVLVLTLVEDDLVEEEDDLDVEEDFVDVERVEVTDLEVDVEDFEVDVEETLTDPLLLVEVESEESMYISSLLPAPQYSYALPGQVNEQSESVVLTDPVLGDVPQ